MSQDTRTVLGTGGMLGRGWHVHRLLAEVGMHHCLVIQEAWVRGPHGYAQGRDESGGQAGFAVRCLGWSRRGPRHPCETCERRISWAVAHCWPVAFPAALRSFQALQVLAGKAPWPSSLQTAPLGLMGLPCGVIAAASGLCCVAQSPVWGSGGSLALLPPSHPYHILRCPAPRHSLSAPPPSGM